MQQAEKRIEFLESRIEEQVMRIDDVRDGVSGLDERMNRRFDLLDQRLDQRFSDVNRRFDGIDARFDRVYGLLIVILVAFVGGMGGIITAILKN